MSTSPSIGTAGWSYPHWNGIVYPKSHTGGFHPLETLAKNFNVVEINSSFYQLLKPELVKLWMKKTEVNPASNSRRKCTSDSRTAASLKTPR